MLYGLDATAWGPTISTSHIMSVQSLEPVASMAPSGENLVNRTSSQWSFMIWIVVLGN